ncbi:MULTISPECIES: glycerophosphoryl diester phosphodiesterase [unclassified Spirosoma]|uniref:glycerophosphoryl diester phosphodiesterase n=1 Tax=unclassified Spirosoma TaxID=2621999 RepID=UPI0009647728|nr:MULTISPECIES: glycerophosphoryl diester phosphodiesterase [unclassified Spirosoma]MBN8822039.1 glycerophosphoryl diester phosphodiesterase [Spirosoma sp.]OJW80447.1 MAG: glycerophosphoryl diester phosphodiesterase [Spirosoma sp. 48-14]
MAYKLKNTLLVACWLIGLTVYAQSGQTVSLANEQVKIVWKNSAKGWTIGQVSVRKGTGWTALSAPSGENTLLYAAEKPSDKPDTTFRDITGAVFPGEKYHYQQEQWAESTSPVSLNKAGQAFYFFPKEAKQTGKNSLQFQQETDVATIRTEWSFDPKFGTDVIVKQTVTPKKEGYFSLASPTLATLTEQSLAWATVPGYFQGNAFQKNFALAYAYGHGIPTLPAIYRERCASTLSPMLTGKNGITLSVIPEPGLARDPWAVDKITQTTWNIGLSHMNRKAQLFPTLYYPILGEPKSALKAGERVTYTFRYSLTDGDWFKALNHAVYDIYRFKETLALRQSKQSLTDRIQKMHHYLTDPKTSMWNIEEFEGKKIGAQSYLGGVVGSNKDAMKNSDYGAMWMLANATKDPLLTQNVLPYALNFKLVQQETANNFFKGAVEGQYYLAKSKKFVEEWGEVVEPIALTYYTMLDMGNMLLFEPTNTELKERLRFGADRLIDWQKSDGHWAVAYDRHTEKEIFKDIQDVRPTFYGLIVAYRLLNDPKYLTAARKGADWFLKNAIETGSFLGVCGDARYAPDFATGQSAQALLDLYDLTKDVRYRDGAIKAAKIYTTSIYTHPIANHTLKTVNGVQREDWEISQTGLSFEHGGIFGSANRAGPIQLCSHAGLFIRMYTLTKEPIFADMARAGAIGRDAFVDAKTSVASYYWNAMNRGAGPYPHHAWWQVGWLTDYLLAEAELRSGGKVTFPRGFVTPKVGPHQTYGFAAGMVNGEKANLIIDENLITIDNPSVDYILAKSVQSGKLFVVLLNNRAQASDCTVTAKNGKPVKKQLPAFGIDVMTLNDKGL